MVLPPYSSFFSVKDWGKRGKQYKIVLEKPYNFPYKFCTEPIYGQKPGKIRVGTAGFRKDFTRNQGQSRQKSLLPFQCRFRCPLTECKHGMDYRAGLHEKGRTEARPRSYHQMLSNNQEIAVSSFPILWSPSRMRWCISLRGCLQPEA